MYPDRAPDSAQPSVSLAGACQCPAIASEQEALLVLQGLLADRHTPWGPSAERDAKDLQLAEVLHKVNHRLSAACLP